jgi:diacylglycerol kinase family enzyme
MLEPVQPDASTTERTTTRPTLDRPHRVKPSAQIVLLCNPRAGGRWRELAGILDSEEAEHVRRIVTDSVDDVGAALSSLDHQARLLCIYGGDGTIQRVLDRLCKEERTPDIQLALLGGGTMNVTSRWCGMSSSPADNFRYVVRSFRSGELLLKEVPLLKVHQGNRIHHGFTFGMGPAVRLLDAYERGTKGKIGALKMASRALSAVWTGRPAALQPLLSLQPATVTLDEDALPFEQYSALFANVTGQINPGVEPFVGGRARDAFFCAAYAVSARELALVLPLILRGWLPIDSSSLLRPTGLLQHALSAYRERRPFPPDPRYVNKRSYRLDITTDERLYTVDGEIFEATEDQFRVDLGPTLKLVVHPAMALKRPARLAAKVMVRTSQ